MTNFDPSALEEVLVQHPSVKEIVLLRFSIGPEWGLFGFVIAIPGTWNDLAFVQDLNQRLKEIADGLKLDQVMIFPDFPRDENAQVLLKVLQSIADKKKPEKKDFPNLSNPEILNVINRIAYGWLSANQKTNYQLAAEDFYEENGFKVMTEAYHLKRGYCCGSRCRHCPYNYINVR